MLLSLLALRIIALGHRALVCTASSEYLLFPLLCGGGGLNLGSRVKFLYLGVGALRVLLGGQLARVVLGAAGLLVVLSAVVRIVWFSAGAVAGEAEAARPTAGPVRVAANR